MNTVDPNIVAKVEIQGKLLEYVPEIEGTLNKNIKQLLGASAPKALLTATGRKSTVFDIFVFSKMEDETRKKIKEAIELTGLRLATQIAHPPVSPDQQVTGEILQSDVEQTGEIVRSQAIDRTGELNMNDMLK